MFLNNKKGMGKLHGNPAKYWEYQQRFTNEKLIPLLEEWGVKPQGLRVLEIGSGDGGIIHAFAEAGAECTSVEINEERVNKGLKFATIEFPRIVGDFCQKDILDQIEGKFDLILLRDVLEHLLDKDTALKNLNKLIAPGGKIFFDFCPWYMPYGGHQQVCDSFLKFVPFLHWLPLNAYKRLIWWSERHRPHVYRDLIDTYKAQITLHSFYSLLERHNMQMAKHQLYLLNPSYEIKFGWPEIKLGRFADIPIVPEIFATNIYALVEQK